MRPLTILFFLFATTFNYSQNNLRLFSANGEVFKVIMDQKELNKIPETNVLIENIKNDTLNLKIAFENQKESIIVVYLLDKGKKTKGREYNYKIFSGKESLEVKFAGINEPPNLVDPIVPKRTEAIKD